jgi:hypothetical protein
MCRWKTAQFCEKDDGIPDKKMVSPKLKRLRSRSSLERVLFLASEMHIDFEAMGLLRCGAPGAERFSSGLIAMRETQRPLERSASPPFSFVSWPVRHAANPQMQSCGSAR